MPAMTPNQISLIRAIVNNDMPQARRCARACVAEDTTKKNEWECKRLAKQLDPALNPDLEKLPWKIEGMLEVEHPKETFQVNRYYLSPREAALYFQINLERQVCDELMAMRIARSNTTLVHGESGTGKTTFGRYVAAMLDLPFYYVNFSRLIDSLLGKTSQNMAMVFDYVRTTPCVFMLDEIDTISTKRKGGGGGVGGELNRVTVTLMQEFDKLQNTQVVIGATNRLDIIDDALLRRFSRVHEITVPVDENEAASVVSLLLYDCGIIYDQDDVVEFCKANKGKSQAWLIGETVNRIAELIQLKKTMQQSGNDALLMHMGVSFGARQNDFSACQKSDKSAADFADAPTLKTARKHEQAPLLELGA